MKKILLGLFVVLTICLCGCDLLNQEEEEKSEPSYPFEVITTDDGDYPGDDNYLVYNNKENGYKGDVYLLKYNTSNTTIEADYTGGVVYTENTGKVLNRSLKNVTGIEIDNVHVDYESVDRMQTFQRNSIDYIKNNCAAIPKNNNSAARATANSNKDTFYINSNISVNNSSYLETKISDNSLVLEYEGKHCNVYYSSINDSNYAKEIDLQSLLEKNNKEKLKKVGTTFDSIYELETKYLGSNIYTVGNDTLYVNTDKKVNIILFDINSDAVENPKLITYGYYSPSDLISNEYYKYYKLPVKSNEAQVLYLDSYSLYKYTNTIYSTIVHEFNHMLNDINKVIKQNLSLNGITWYTEMLSMVSEDLFSNYLNLKLSATPRARLYSFNETYYAGFTTWFNGDDVLYSYANAFAYGSFLVRNYGGLELLNEIATNEAVGKKSIEQALKKLKYEDTFDDTVNKYYKATYNSTSEGYTFNREISNTDEGLGFVAIDLFNLDGKNRNTSKVIPDPYDCNEQVDLYPTGCSFHYVGKDVNTFVFLKPESSFIVNEVICIN